MRNRDINKPAGMAGYVGEATYAECGVRLPAELRSRIDANVSRDACTVKG